MRMKIYAVFVCLFVGLSLSPLTIAGQKKEGGGGRAAHAGGGGRGGGGGGGRFGGASAGGHAGAAHGMPRAGGGGQHAGRNFQGGGSQGRGLNANHQGGGQHGLNSNHQAGGQHGLNSRHQAGGAGLNGRGRGGLQANHGGNFARNGNGRWAGYRAAHWRGVSHWRSSHEVFHSYRAVWHDHVWWGSHYDVTFVAGGWGPWYWDGGYWFPAWGYYPGFTFVFDRPIYAYANLPPDQVVVNVQEALQDQGYYRGEVDGQLGQQTRDALQQYQQEHSLEVTAAIDEPTVQSLGLETGES